MGVEMSRVKVQVDSKLRINGVNAVRRRRLWLPKYMRSLDVNFGGIPNEDVYSDFYVEKDALEEAEDFGTFKDD